MRMIVALASNGAIGKDNNLLWHLPEDLKFFKKVTTGKNIVMGRKTFESTGVLPNRHHYVLTRDTTLVNKPHVSYINSFDTIPADAVICGGAEIYKEALKAGLVDDVIITEVFDFEGDFDTQLPLGEIFKYFKRSSMQVLKRQHIDEKHKYGFVTYRISN